MRARRTEFNSVDVARALPFVSCYVYAPRGAGAIAEASRRLCVRVKTLDPVWLPHYVALIHETSFKDARVRNLFAPDAVLVPVPGSARTGDASWPALQLAVLLRSLGLGSRVWRGLGRVIAVRKSATAPSAARPSVRDHYESFSVTLGPPIARIVLIDDVITKGRTALAAAARLRSACPDADVSAFALIRTLGFAGHLEHLVAWCHGVVRWAGNDARREP